MRLTEEVFRRAMSDRGGYTRDQLSVLGVAWPPVTGWKKQLLDKELPDEVVGRFIALRKGSKQ